MEIRQRIVGGIVFLDLKGRFVMDEGEAVREAVNRQLSKGRRQFVLNLEDVTFMDTSGLSTIIGVRLAIQRQDGEIRLLNLPTRVKDLLVITRLITLFEIAESEADVQNSFAPAQC
jgi:anti-sigma B factor antagonist